MKTLVNFQRPLRPYNVPMSVRLADARAAAADERAAQALCETQWEVVALFVESPASAQADGEAPTGQEVA